MNMRVVLPAVAALALLAASPSSAQTYVRYGYDMQAGGGAGPYDLRCRSYRNFSQRQRCTQLATFWYPHRHYYRRWW
jgi:hypothetical protein